MPQHIGRPLRRGNTGSEIRAPRDNLEIVMGVFYNRIGRLACSGCACE
jgi:hypothetical protein